MASHYFGLSDFGFPVDLTSLSLDGFGVGMAMLRDEEIITTRELYFLSEVRSQGSGMRIRNREVVLPSPPYTAKR
jgi:hypothetical protein